MVMVVETIESGRRNLCGGIENGLHMDGTVVRGEMWAPTLGFNNTVTLVLHRYLIFHQASDLLRLKQPRQLQLQLRGQVFTIFTQQQILVLTMNIQILVWQLLTMRMPMPAILSLGSDTEKVMLAPVMLVMRQQNLLLLLVLHCPSDNERESHRDLEQLQFRHWHLAMRYPQIAIVRIP